MERLRHSQSTQLGRFTMLLNERVNRRLHRPMCAQVAPRLVCGAERLRQLTASI